MSDIGFIKQTVGCAVCLRDLEADEGELHLRVQMTTDSRSHHLQVSSERAEPRQEFASESRRWTQPKCPLYSTWPQSHTQTLDPKTTSLNPNQLSPTYTLLSWHPLHFEGACGFQGCFCAEGYSGDCSTCSSGYYAANRFSDVNVPHGLRFRVLCVRCWC